MKKPAVIMYCQANKIIVFLAALCLLGCAETPKGRLSLAMQTVKKAYSEDEPYIVEYCITNKGRDLLTVDTGFQGVHKFSFLLRGQKYSTNQTYPKGGLDFGKRRFLLQPNHQVKRHLALNGWTSLNPGGHEVTGIFDTKAGVIKSKFMIYVTNKIQSNEAMLDSWYAYCKECGFDETQRDEFIRCIASVCVKNPKMEEEAILLKKSPVPDKSKFFGDLVFYTQQSWDAID